MNELLLFSAEGYLQRCCPCGGCLEARELSSQYSNPHNTNQQEYPTTRCCLFSTSQIEAEKESSELHDYVTYTSDKVRNIVIILRLYMTS